MQKTDMKKRMLHSIPYVFFGLLCTNFGEAWRLAEGFDYTERLQDFFIGIPQAFQNILPGLHLTDLLWGVVGGLFFWLGVQMKKQNTKKYRHGEEYGSARWGNAKDIAPFVDPVFSNNVILTESEFLTMNSRPKNPEAGRNKNVLIIGGSGSGKTRFWIKPNLLQMHSSYVVTDPKMTKS